MARSAVRFTVILLMICIGAHGAAPGFAEIRAAHDRVLSQMNVKGPDGKPMELDDPRIAPLLKSGWQLAGEWAAAWLDERRGATRGELSHIFEGFAPKPQGVKSKYGNFLEYNDYGFRGSAIRIAPGVYVAEASYGFWALTGTFMVVARDDSGKFQARWNIKDLAEKHYAERDEIGRWVHLVRRAYYNGPLTVKSLVPLSAAANGRARFAVDAFQGADGGTTLCQLSIWEWNGEEARPLLIKQYEHGADFGYFDFDGTTFRISTKEPLETFWSCGMCADPQGVWTVRVTPNGVEDLGHRYLQPQIHWADELLALIGAGRDTGRLCEPRVRAAIDAWIRNAKTQSGDESFSWGMLGDCRVLQRGRVSGKFDIQTEGGRLRFRYLLRGGRAYFTGVSIE